MAEVAVIVPTIREHRVVERYLQNAQDSGFALNRLFFIIVTEDATPVGVLRRYLKDLGVDGEVYGQKERENWFRTNGIGELSSIIPRRSHAETSFGLLRMLEDDSLRYGVFIDDDTAPLEGEDYFGEHLRNLSHNGPATEVSTGKWTQVLLAAGLKDCPPPRGFPFSVEPSRPTKRVVNAEKIVLSQGLWVETPDLDAVRILARGGPSAVNGIPNLRVKRSAYDSSFVAPIGAPVTICSMNLAFTREVVPSFYQLPMDDNPWGVGRFDDIWSGLILKRICDSFGWFTIHGMPLCSHNKAPRNVFRDLMLEAAGLAINERLGQLTADVILDGTIEERYYTLAEAFERGKWDTIANGGFINHMGTTMKRWLKACEVARH